MSPRMNIGFRPTMSAALGSMNEPIKVPTKKDEPIYPIFILFSHVKSYCSTQLWILL